MLDIIEGEFDALFFSAEMEVKLSAWTIVEEKVEVAD